MRLWTAIPRGARDRLTGIAPESWWIWLRELRETKLDRHWNAGQILLHAYPKLAAEPPQLNRVEARVYSQNGEDGILAWLLAEVGASNRTFVEFGIGDGSECNTANLSRTFGWSGLLMEADAESVERASVFYRRFPGVRVVHAEVTPENVDALLLEHGPGQVDLLSIDIDGNDYWVWRAITAIDPRVVVIEYNATFGAERSVSVPQKDGFDRYDEHVSGFYHGASLSALAKLGRDKGYALVGCDSRGANAFFVRRDLLGEPLVEVDVDAAWFPLWERAHLDSEQQFAQVSHLPLVDV
jgi:methyltransferase FkbM-like protein